MAAPTKEEQELLTKFRIKITDLALNEDQNSDMYLLRWIRARDGKLDQSETMLRKSLKWREEFGADSVLTWETPSVVLELLPWDTTNWDKNNRPVVILPIGRWDLRKAVDTGNADNCVRYVCQLWETLLEKMKGKTTKDGVPVTQITFIVDMDDLGMKTVGSFAILEVFKLIVGQFEANYPEILSAAYVVNASRIFQILWAVIRPLLSPQTFSKVQIHGSPPKWRPLLLEAIEPDQLPEFYGGSKDSTLHSFYNYTMKNKRDESYEDVTVAAGDILKVPVEVTNEKSSLNWDFTTEYYDIEFFVTLNDKTVVSKKKVDSHKAPVVGSYKCKAAGTYVLHFDNGYSRMRSKALRYSVKVVDRAASVKK